ncbi:integrase catalytic domain-containing protein [Dechloromonas denitrificans]|uniref:integrase catalytic domain-containing protein n=1 Tax=Dechloromonas denitrificans TaxID=281362 RepID=UPI001CFB7EF2|nr:DDE-type integrase/transposase/recombinase [Dechloromonas denitrificans]UCV09418.1 DDE-type integrase/transposase/recombinase [Dechloromonas denitrificans]
MMDTTQLDAYCERHGITPKARLIIDQVRTSDPTRRVQSGTHNVACRYSSRKMGLVIQAESHKNELPAVIGWEHDGQTYEFYDQPPKVKLRYTGRNGKPAGHLATPDYFLLQEGFSGWVECKTEDWLQARVAEGSTLYVRDGTKGWRCPAGEEYAASVDLGFRVRSSSATHWITIRNLEFLADYLDERCPAPPPEATQRVQDAMGGQAWVILKDLLGALPIDDADVLYKMIADGVLYTRLEKDLLAEPERAVVFRDKVSADAYGLYLASQTETTLPSLRTLTIAAGQSLLWDGRVWRILNVGDQDVFLEDEERVITSVGRKIFEQMVKDGVITGIPAGATLERDQAEEIVRRASPDDFEHAMYRYRCLFPERSDGVPADSCDRAKRKWRALYLRGQELYGSGLLGLIPKISQRGNRERRLDEAVIKIMDDVIDEHYAVEDGWSITACSGEVTNRCNERGLLPPSEVALRDQIKRRHQHDLVVVREGEKAAYSDSEFYWRIDGATPRHGERPFEIGHIDHTELDLQFRGSRKGEKMGKAWLSVLIDAWSRMILAWVITFDAPSYRTCMTLIRACIKRHGRIPRTIVVDKGAEFQSIYFETLLGRLECHKKTRPGSKPRFGSIIERFFGMNDEQFVHCLRGNNVALQTPRSMSKSHDPRELSVWTLPDFREAFDGYLDQVYGEMEHSALGMSPKAAMSIGLAQSGLRRHTLIPNTRDLLILCLPSTRKGTAKIDASRGVKIGYIYYWCPAFRNPKLARADVPVRYDPNDKSVAMVWLKDHWETCQSEYADIFRGRTEKEIDLITQEITAQNKLTGQRRTINASLIAKYLSGTCATEKLLQQRLRDQENHSESVANPSSQAAPASRSDLEALEDATWAALENNIFGD